MNKYEDLREFIEQVDALGALRRVEGADPLYEVGGITEVAAGSPECPALLFDQMKGFARGFRIFTNATVSAQRAALALGIDPHLPPIDALKEWRNRRGALTMHKPVTVKEGLVLQNPSPEPRSISDVSRPLSGTGTTAGLTSARGASSSCATRSRAGSNASIYRVQVHGKDRVTVQFDHQGRHGAIIARNYWESGKPCPVAVVNGPDPSLFIAGFEYLPEGTSEYDFAGAIRGRPLQVIEAPLTRLPVPARAEMVLEGFLATDTLPEGPFGEFTGYYAAEKRPAPLMKVEAVHWRNDPILLGSPPMKPPRFHFGLPFRAASMWSQLEAAGVTDVVGAWQHVAQLMTVIAIRQRYAGHSKRAGLFAAAQSYMGRIVVTVDDDVDPSNLADVMWAIATRCEPSEQVDIVRQAWSSALDPRITVENRERGQTSHSKMIIDACKPFGWRDTFPKTSALSRDDARAIREKWFDKP